MSFTLAEPGERLIVINSFSKAWSMTGWRLGWMVVPPAIQDDLGSLLEYNISCVSEFIQRAGATALQQGEPYVCQLRAQLANTKENCLPRCPPSPAASTRSGRCDVSLLRVAGEEDSVRLANRLIEDVGLGLAPDRAFGPEGEGWLRWCYAADSKKIESGIQRLAHFLSK